MLIAKRHLFKGVENYFTNSLLYQDSLETDENPQPEELDSGSKADVAVSYTHLTLPTIYSV